MEERKENQDRNEDVIYGINSDQQAKINAILKCLEIEPRKTQNINFIKIDVKVVYSPKQNKVRSHFTHN